MTSRVVFRLAVIGLAVLLPAVAMADFVQVAFRLDGGLFIVAREVPSGQASAQAALVALAAGPTADERAAGIDSAIPPGTLLLAFEVIPGGVKVDFSLDIVADGLDDLTLQAIYEQVVWTLTPFGLERSVMLTAGGTPLWQYLPPAPRIQPRKDMAEPPPITTAGTALAGRKISLSPGHGRVWTGTGWGYERSVNCPPLSREDLHNVDLVIYLDAFLVQDGAITKNYRCINQSYGNYPLTGDPWWYMSASYWLQHIGYPCWVYASWTGDCVLGSGAHEGNDSLRSRPLASDYDNTDLYISMHTNAYAGDCYGTNCPNGTCTYYDTSTEHAPWGTISRNAARAVNNAIVSIIRNHYTDATWYDRGALDANGSFAETRIPDRAAILIELAFHDSCDRDAVYLRDNFFRSATMWGAYKGVCDYFGTTPTYGFYSSEVVGDTIPTTMQPGQSVQVTVTMRNRGVLWTDARGYRLGAVGDSDPFTAFNRVPVTGEVGTGQSQTFTFTLTAPTTPGTYLTDWRMVRDGFTWFGPTVSRNIQVASANPDAPAITGQPTAQTVPNGASATFTVTATGGPPLSYRWQRNGVDLSDGTKLFGAATPVLEISAADASLQGNYRCVVTNAHGTAISAEAALTVVPNIFVVESRAGGQNRHKYSEAGVLADSSAKSTAAGTTPGIGSRYGSTYRSVAGEKHGIFSADLPAFGDYEVFATWGAGSNRRSPILHRVTHAGGSADVNVDQAATANVWQPLGTYRFSAGTDAGQVDVSNLNIDVSGSFYADAVKWEFRSGLQPPTISQQPAATTVCDGAAAQFTVTASGDGPLTYRWQKDGVALTDGGRVSGATGPTLTISGVQASDVGLYRCVVRNPGGNTFSGTAALSLGALVITQHPQSRSADPGETVVFTVAASGLGSLSYRWQMDGADLVDGGPYSGCTTPTLTISNVSGPQAGAYRCVIQDACSTAVSDLAMLSVSGPLPVPGDFDGDRDVDQADFGRFQVCITGATVPQLDPQCQGARLDEDQDVDASDLQIMLGCMTAPGVEGDPYCAN